MKHVLPIVLLIAFAGNRLQAAPENSSNDTKDPTTRATIPVTVSADNQGLLTCAVTSLTLYASTTATGVTYHWTSTNGFESDIPNPTITATGTYTVKVTNSSGSGKASITITEYKTCPDVTASGSSLSCLPQATLYASSKVPNARYSWVGPYYFTSTLQRPTVVDAGTYTVTVTDPSNGCYTSKAVEVTAATSSTLWAASFTVPDGTTRIDTGRYQWTAIHTGTSATKFSPKNYEFRAGNMGAGKEGTWTSQAINIAGKANVGVAVHVRSYAASGEQFEADTTAIGDYLRLYYKLDGGPEVLFAEQSGAINNNYENYTTLSTRSLAGSTIRIIIRARATEAGEYYYFDNVTVTGARGVDVQAAVSGNSMITCTNSTVTLNGTSSVTGSFSWQGPNGFTSSEQNITVNTAGSYTLRVTEPAKGCWAESQVVVTQNTTPPPAITATHMGRVTCDSPAFVAGTVPSGLHYSWTGPEGYTANTLTATVIRGGTYTLTATDPVNGCTTSANTHVEESTGVPSGISITNPGSITCLNPIIPLIGFSSAENAIYNWRGPNGYTASSLMIEVQKAGDYTLKVTDTINGCSDSVTTTVIDNAQPPAVTIINTSPLSCTNKVVTLEAVMNIANPQILWSGPGFSSQNAKTTTNRPGNYSLYVGDLDNGCSATFPVKVTGSVTGCGREATGADNTSSATAQNAAAEAITKFAYKAYPNPVTSNGVIEFASPESTTVTVSVYNSSGVCEKVLFKGNAAAQQRYKLAVPATQLPAGAYYYTINTGGKIYSGRLVIVK